MPARPRTATNPLTGELSILAPIMPARSPQELARAVQGRTLPMIAPECGPCPLCTHRPARRIHGSGTISSWPNDNPLTDRHTLLVTDQHLSSPALVSPDVWLDWLDALRDLGAYQPGTIHYANLGPHSGATERHIHGHVLQLDLPASSAAERPCPVCTGQLTPLVTTPDWALSHIPAGRSGEVLIHPRRHIPILDADPQQLAGLLARCWQAYAPVWDSGTMALVRPAGHEGFTLAPVHSAAAALELDLQVNVSRIDGTHLAMLLAHT